MKSYDFIIEFLAYEMPLGNNLVCFHVRPLFSSLFIYARAAGSDECNEERANA